MVAGLMAVGRAANEVSANGKARTVGASSGPCLQQNLICVLEA
jgi:hypothetical protein